MATYDELIKSLHDNTQAALIARPKTVTMNGTKYTVSNGDINLGTIRSLPLTANSGDTVTWNGSAWVATASTSQVDTKTYTITN